MSQERLPPHDVNAEKAVLGCILRDNQCLDEALLLIKAESFYGYAHQRIFQVCVDLAMKGIAFDTVTVADRLFAIQQAETEATRQKTNLIADIGGYEYLAELWDAAPSAGNTIYYAEIVRDKAILREVIRTAGNILESAWAPGARTAQQVLEDAERKVCALSEVGVTGLTIPAPEAARLAWDVLQDRIQMHRVGQVPGVKTGLYSFDRFGCGMQPGELIVLAARTSVGKTAMMLQMVRAACESGVPAFVASLEQPVEELEFRFWCSVAKVSSYRVRKGGLHDEEIDALRWARDQAAAWPMEIDQMPGATVTRIAANARRLRRQGRCGIVFIDYLQLIEPENSRIQRHEQVAQVTKRLKLLARDLGVPVVVLAQLNREADRGEAPRLSHLRESGAIEQDADTVVLMHRESDVNPPPDVLDVSVNIAKQRNGPPEQFLLKYTGPFFLFEDYRSEPTEVFV